MNRNMIWILLLLPLFLGACTSDSSIPLATETPPAIIDPTQTSTFMADAAVDETELLADSLPEGIEIDFWHPWSGEIVNLVDELIEEYNSTNQWKITVNGFAHADERMLMRDFYDSITEESNPDLIAAPPAFLQFLLEQGYFLADMEIFLDSAVWGFPNESVPQFLPLFWGSDFFNGTRIGIPAYRSLNLLFINETWARELGFSELPANLDNFQDLVCAAAESYRIDNDPGNDGYGGLLYAYDDYAILSWMKAYGGGLPTSNAEMGSLSNEKNITALEFLHDLFFSDCIWVQGLDKQPKPHQYFSSRLSIAYSATLEDLLIQENVNRINNIKDKWTILPYPSSGGKPVAIIDGFSYAIIDQGDKEKSLAAWDFIRWMMRIENQVRLIEKSGSLPLSTDAIGMLDEFASTHEVWRESLQYLSLAQASTNTSDWLIVQDILTDISRRLIQYTTSKEDIPLLLENADELLQELQVQR